MVGKVKRRRVIHREKPPAMVPLEVPVVTIRVDGVFIGRKNGHYVAIQPDNIEPYYHPQKKKDQLQRWQEDGGCYVVVKDPAAMEATEAPPEPPRYEPLRVATASEAASAIDRDRRKRGVM